MKDLTPNQKAHARNGVAAVAFLIFYLLFIHLLGAAVDHVLDNKGIAVASPKPATAQVTAFPLSDMPGYHLQGTTPDLQPADRVQPQQATGGVASY